MDGVAVNCQNWPLRLFPITRYGTAQIRRYGAGVSLKWNWHCAGSERKNGNRLLTQRCFCGSRRSETKGWRANSSSFSGKVEWDGSVVKLEGNVSLELEIFKFMQGSDKPNDFPSKDELVRAGRSDLVNAIIAEGGWLTAGWDSQVDDDPHDEILDDEGLIHNVDDSHRANVELRPYSPGHSELYDEQNEGRTSISTQPADDVGTSGLSRISPALPTSEKSYLGSSADVRVDDMSHSPVGLGDEESGIAGMLNRLERERTLSYSEASAGKKGKEFKEFKRSDEYRESWDRVTKIFGVRGMQLRSINDKGKEDLRSLVLKASQDTLQSLGRDAAQTTVESSDLDCEGTVTKAKQWGFPSLEHMENSQKESEGVQGESEGIWQRERRIGHRISTEAMETDDEMKVADKINAIIDRRQEWMLDVKTRYGGHLHRLYSGDVPNTIMSRIQNLEFQLASTLGSLRSGEGTFNTKSYNKPLKELEEASDALEFRETEIMRTRAKLRSTRAKLAALEGKMAIAIMEVRKIIEEKQRRLEEAQKILSLMRAVRIVWSYSALEVLLSGSFDGWTSQRRMTKSNAGVFVASLHLYPGRYEIKFIVDGVWRVDPQRPVVYSNGFENNLLLIF